MHSQDIPREIVRVRREEPYVHAFVTVPVWHNPRADRGDAPGDHPTPPTDARTVQRSRRLVALLLRASAPAALGFLAAYVAVPADALITVGPFVSIRAPHFTLGMTLSATFTCLGAAARGWARIQLSRAEATTGHREATPPARRSAPAPGA